MLALFRSGLFRRLFAAMMALTIIIIAASMIWTSIEYDSRIRAETTLRHDSISKRIALEMALFFDHATYQLVIFSDFLKYTNEDKASLSAILNDISLDAPHFMDIAVIDMSGREIAASIQVARPPAVFPPKEPERMIHPWISKVALDVNRVPYLEMSTPVILLGATQKMIMARLSLKKLWYWIDEINTESNSTLTIAKTETGLVIADQRKELIGQIYSGWRTRASSGATRATGSPEYVSFHDVPKMDLTIITQSAMPGPGASIYQARYRLLMMATGLTILAALLAAAFSARASRPARILIEAMTQYASSGRKITAITEGEYGRIADAFNQVAATLEANHKSLITQESLVTVGRVAAILTHELRHDLQSINNEVYIMEAKKENKDTLNRIVALLAVKISSIMEMARGSRVEPYPFDAHRLLSDAYDYVMISDFAMGVDVAIQENGAKTFSAPLDKRKMTLSLSNLVRNSVEAQARKVRITCHQEESGFAVFTVSDDGKGFPPSVREKMMDPFFTTKKKGYGLGLAFVNSVAKAHGGWVDLESEEGRGAVARIFIPLATQKNIVKREASLDATYNATRPQKETVKG